MRACFGIFWIVLGILIKNFRLAGRLSSSQHRIPATVAAHAIAFQRRRHQRFSQRCWHGDDGDDGDDSAHVFLNSNFVVHDFKRFSADVVGRNVVLEPATQFDMCGKKETVKETLEVVYDEV